MNKNFFNHNRVAGRYIENKTFDKPRIIQCLVSNLNNILHKCRKINGAPKGIYLTISKLHSIIAIANLLEHS